MHRKAAVSVCAPTYVHGNSADFRPAVSLGLVLVVRPTCLQHGLVNAAAAGYDA